MKQVEAGYLQNDAYFWLPVRVSQAIVQGIEIDTVPSRKLASLAQFTKGLVLVVAINEVGGQQYQMRFCDKARQVKLMLGGQMVEAGLGGIFEQTGFHRLLPYPAKRLVVIVGVVILGILASDNAPWATIASSRRFDCVFGVVAALLYR